VKNILISIKPEYTAHIYDGNKTVELRKKIGKEFSRGSKLYIYSSSPVKMITGEAEIADIFFAPLAQIKKKYLSYACISDAAFHAYFSNSPHGYAILLKNVKEYEKKIPLFVLRTIGITPPQSFSYINEKQTTFLQGG
jgi:predicted transcriptional regulator